MPNRIIKESICRSDNLDRLTAEEERFFYRLMVQCDDYGRYDGRPSIIKGACFPLKSYITPNKVDKMMASLRDAALIFVYVVDGLPYIQMAKWEKHQQIRAKRSKYPEPNSGTLDLLSSEIIGNQPKSLDSTCPRNPIQSESNPNPNPIQEDKLKMKKDDLTTLTEHYATIRGARPRGNAWKPIQQGMKAMVADEEYTVAEVIGCMDRLVEWEVTWTINTVRKWIADYAAGKMPSKNGGSATPGIKRGSDYYERARGKTERMATPEDDVFLKALEERQNKPRREG